MKKILFILLLAAGIIESSTIKITGGLFFGGYPLAANEIHITVKAYYHTSALGNDQVVVYHPTAVISAFNAERYIWSLTAPHYHNTYGTCYAIAQTCSLKTTHKVWYTDNQESKAHEKDSVYVGYDAPFNDITVYMHQPQFIATTIIKISTGIQTQVAFKSWDLIGRYENRISTDSQGIALLQGETNSTVTLYPKPFGSLKATPESLSVTFMLDTMNVKFTYPGFPHFTSATICTLLENNSSPFGTRGVYYLTYTTSGLVLTDSLIKRTVSPNLGALSFKGDSLVFSYYPHSPSRTDTVAFILKDGAAIFDTLTLIIMYKKGVSILPTLTVKQAKTEPNTRQFYDLSGRKMRSAEVSGVCFKVIGHAERSQKIVSKNFLVR